MAKTHPVVTRSNRGQWEVVVAEKPELSRSYSSREEAIEAGSAIADQLRTSHVVEDAEATGVITDPQPE